MVHRPISTKEVDFIRDCKILHQLWKDVGKLGEQRKIPGVNITKLFLCYENLFRISNLIKSNRQNKLELGVGFKAKARASAYFAQLGWRCGCIFVDGVCVCVMGWAYMVIWLGCVRRVGMYWEGKTAPLYHICYIKFISSWKNYIPSTW